MPNRNESTPVVEEFVGASDLEVAAVGTDALEAAFQSRLREVETHPGFHRLEVWRARARGVGVRRFTVVAR